MGGRKLNKEHVQQEHKPNMGSTQEKIGNVRHVAEFGELQQEGNVKQF